MTISGPSTAIYHLMTMSDLQIKFKNFFSKTEMPQKNVTPQKKEERYQQNKVLSLFKKRKRLKKKEKPQKKRGNASTK